MKKKLKKRKNMKYYHFVMSVWSHSNTDDLCKHLVIEAGNREKAIQKILKMGYYLQGKENTYQTKTLYNLRREITDFPFQMEDARLFFRWDVITEEEARELWLKRFKKRNITSLEIIKDDWYYTPYGVRGTKKICNIEEYCRFIAAKWNFDDVDEKIRLVYRNGSIKDFL